jgi:two-component system phosphate regulon sensor histidine kinase PhoR
MLLSSVSVTEAVDRVYDLYGPQAEQQGKQFTKEMPPDFPAAMGDMDRLVQILTNLVDNAIKYTPPGGSIILGGQTTDGTVEIWVRDTGPGIAPEMASLVFEKFAQVRPAAQVPASQRGVGLGLYLARTLALRQGGDVSVESRVGEGSTFTLTLPRADATLPTGGGHGLGSFFKK